MRTVLAAAAAGALVMGSAAGAMATPAKGKPAPAPRIQSVSIHGHSPVNVFSVDSARPIKLRATVRYAKGETPDRAAPPAAEVWLDTFSKKVAGAPIVTPTIKEPLVWSSQSRKDVRYRTTFNLTLDEVGALQVAVANAADSKTKVYLCISNVAVDGVSIRSNKVMKRLGGKGKPARDCVKVINVDPKLTDTTKDDGPKPS